MATQIRRKTVDNTVERRLATGMIVSARVLREVSTIYNPDWIDIPYVRRIAGWCLEYWKRYNQPPLQHIKDIFQAQERKGKLGEDEAQLIGDFLGDLSEEYEHATKFNEQYLLDEVEERFKIQSLRNLSEDIQAALSNGSEEEAETLLTDFRKVSRPKSDGIDPFADVDAIQQAFENRSEPLFTFPGPAGEMLNDQLVRGRLVGLMGRAKIGKTSVLFEMAIRAAKARCNVAVFELGDESQEDAVARLHMRLAGKSNMAKYCREMWVPVLDCERNQNGLCNSKNRTNEVRLDGASPESAPKGYQPCSYCHDNRPDHFPGTAWYIRQPEVSPLTWREGFKIAQGFQKRLKGRFFRLVTRPNSSTNVADLQAILDKWEHFEGWVPDVIVIDYADIMAPEPGDGRKETRDQQNGTWKALRRLSQERHCLVFSATQTDSASYDVFRLKLNNFSEDRRKYDHVTAMMGLNQTEEEKQRGIMRWNWILLRHGDFDSSEMIAIIQCLQKGKPFLGGFKYKPKKTEKVIKES